MGYIAVSGGVDAIEASIERLRYERLRKGRILEVSAVEAGMRALIDQVMSESSLYDEEMAALAIKQAEGSPEEAVFLLRAFRSTLPRSHYSLTIDTRNMRVDRRISASFKDIPGGQILGASCDYTHRLIDTGLIDESEKESEAWLEGYLARTGAGVGPTQAAPPLSAIDYVRSMGLLHDRPLDETAPRDITKRALEFPATRSERMQILTRGQTGAVTALGYAAIRGYGATLHPTVGELRVGSSAVLVPDPYEGEPYYVGQVRMTAVETLVPVHVSRGPGRSEIEFDIGFGASFGQNETKAIAVSILDQCLESGEKRFPTQDEEFVLLHVDSVEATGFISHLKLPHYVSFQSKLDSVRKARGGA